MNNINQKNAIYSIRQSTGLPYSDIWHVDHEDQCHELNASDYNQSMTQLLDNDLYTEKLLSQTSSYQVGPKSESDQLDKKPNGYKIYGDLNGADHLDILRKYEKNISKTVTKSGSLTGNIIFTSKFGDICFASDGSRIWWSQNPTSDAWRVLTDTDGHNIESVAYYSDGARMMFAGHSGVYLYGIYQIQDESGAVQQTHTAVKLNSGSLPFSPVAISFISDTIYIAGHGAAMSGRFDIAKDFIDLKSSVVFKTCVFYSDHGDQLLNPGCLALVSYDNTGTFCGLSSASGRSDYAGLYRHSVQQLYDIDELTGFVFQNSHVRCIQELAGIVYVGTENGLFTLSGRELLPDIDVGCFYVYAGKLYILGKNVLSDKSVMYSINGNGQVSDEILDRQLVFPDDVRLNDEYITCIVIKNDFAYVGSATGLYEFDLTETAFRANRVEFDSVSHAVTSVCDVFDSVLIGTEDGCFCVKPAAYATERTTEYFAGATLNQSLPVSAVKAVDFTGDAYIADISSIYRKSDMRRIEFANDESVLDMVKYGNDRLAVSTTDTMYIFGRDLQQLQKIQFLSGASDLQKTSNGLVFKITRNNTEYISFIPDLDLDYITDDSISMLSAENISQIVAIRDRVYVGNSETSAASIYREMQDTLKTNDNKYRRVFENQYLSSVIVLGNDSVLSAFTRVDSSDDEHISVNTWRFPGIDTVIDASCQELYESVEPTIYVTTADKTLAFDAALSVDAEHRPIFGPDGSLRFIDESWHDVCDKPISCFSDGTYGNEYGIYGIGDDGIYFKGFLDDSFQNIYRISAGVPSYMTAFGEVLFYTSGRTVKTLYRGIETEIEHHVESDIDYCKCIAQSDSDGVLYIGSGNLIYTWNFSIDETGVIVEVVNEASYSLPPDVIQYDAVKSQFAETESDDFRVFAVVTGIPVDYKGILFLTDDGVYQQSNQVRLVKTSVVISDIANAWMLESAGHLVYADGVYLRQNSSNGYLARFSDTVKRGFSYNGYYFAQLENGDFEYVAATIPDMPIKLMSYGSLSGDVNSIFLIDANVSFAASSGVFITHPFIDRYPLSIDQIRLPVFTHHVISLFPSSTGGEASVIAKKQPDSDLVEAWILTYYSQSFSFTRLDVIFDNQPLNIDSFVYQDGDCSKLAYITSSDTGVQRWYTLKYGQTLAKRLGRSAWTDCYRVRSVLSFAGGEYWLRENLTSPLLPSGIVISNGWTYKDTFVQDNSIQPGEPVIQFTSEFNNGFIVRTPRAIYRFSHDGIYEISELPSDVYCSPITAYDIGNGPSLIYAEDKKLKVSQNGKMWKPFFDLPAGFDTVNSIMPVDSKTYLFGTDNGLYYTEYEYDIIPDVSVFTRSDANQLYDNLMQLPNTGISSTVSTAISSHILSEHSSGSVITRMNNDYLNINMEDIQDWQEQTETSNSVTVRRDIVAEMTFGDQNDGDFTITVGNFLSTFNPEFTYITKRWMSGITDVYIHLPTTMTYYLANTFGASNCRLDPAAAYIRENLTQFGQDVALQDSTLSSHATDIVIGMTSAEYQPDFMIGAQINGMSLPRGIYCDTYGSTGDPALMYRSFIEPSVVKTFNIRNTDGDGNYLFNFACFGTDEQAIRLSFYDSRSRLNLPWIRVVFDPNGGDQQAVKQKFLISEDGSIEQKSLKPVKFTNTSSGYQKIFAGWTLTPQPDNYSWTTQEYDGSQIYEDRQVFPYYSDFNGQATELMRQPSDAFMPKEEITLYAAWLTYQFTDADTAIALDSNMTEFRIQSVGVDENTNLKRNVVINFGK